MRCGQPAAEPSAIDWVERMAVGASVLCLIHCAGLPLLLAALPALSRLVALPEALHLWILVLAVPSSGLALLVGTWRHRLWQPLLAGGIGLALLAAGALVFAETSQEVPLTIAGSLFLVFGHVRNWRLRHRHHRHG